MNDKYYALEYHNNMDSVIWCAMADIIHDTRNMTLASRHNILNGIIESLMCIA